LRITFGVRKFCGDGPPKRDDMGKCCACFGVMMQKPAFPCEKSNLSCARSFRDSKSHGSCGEGLWTVGGMVFAEAHLDWKVNRGPSPWIRSGSNS